MVCGGGTAWARWRCSIGCIPCIDWGGRRNEVVLGHRSAETDVSVAADALWAWADASGEAPATQKHWELEPEPQAQPLERSL